MSVATQFRWKRAVNGLRFLQEEYDLVKEVSDVTGPEFQKYYEKFCTENDVDIGELNAKHAERVKEAYGIKEDLGQLPDEDLRTKEELLEACDTMIARFQGTQSEEGRPIIDKEIHDTFTRLFKAIATHVHPDKARDDITRTLFEQAFKEAKQALDKQQYFKLLEMAEELDIELPKNYNEQIRWMGAENKRLRGLIQKAMQTYNYLFYDCDSDVNRDNLIRSFLKQLFDLDIPQKNT
jgi:hypothetical protein|tara:strand:- start:110 stop:820 length:711 start_codon:yes stop_codon:yes gene_type:complete